MSSQIACSLAVDFLLRLHPYPFHPSVKVFLGEEAKFSSRLIVRDCTAHHHLVEITGFQSEVPAASVVVIKLRSLSIFIRFIIVACTIGKPEPAVCQPIVFFCFRCKVKFDPKWPNGEQMGKVYKKEMRHTVVCERYSAWV